MASKRPRARAESPQRRRRGGARRKKGAAGGGGRAGRWWVRWLLKPAIFVGLAGAIFAALVAWSWYRDLPDVEQLLRYDPPQTTRVLDRKGTLIGERFSERRSVVPMKRIPRVLVLSVLAAEDADFYTHPGLDFQGIARILLKTALEGRASQGASTITQQVVKNLLLTPERSIKRKFKELVLARRLENELTKDEILFLYLNHINFGHARYGVQEAAHFYFDKDVADLSLAEAALMAGLPQAPSRLSPRKNLEAAKRRRAFVLGQLERKRAQYWADLPQADIDDARAQWPPKLAPVPATHLRAPEALQRALDTLREAVGEKAFAHGGYTVHTSIDLDLQRAARDALRRGLRSVDDRQGVRQQLRRVRKRRKTPPGGKLVRGKSYDFEVRSTDDDQGQITLRATWRNGPLALMSATALERLNPGGLPPSKLVSKGARIRASVIETGDGAAARIEPLPQAEGALVLIDARSRQVLAMVGGYEAAGGFNRATQARRQPGSTFKPIAYAQALKSRQVHLATPLLDRSIVDAEGWKPDNYDAQHSGYILLRDAVARSVNAPIVDMLLNRGGQDEQPVLALPEVVKLAHALGIRSELSATPSLVLGSSEVNLLELTNAYTTFAAGGRYEAPVLVTKVLDPRQRTVKLAAPAPGREAMSPAEAYLVTDLLRSVVDEGTARRARRLGRPVAGKTGTTNNAQDAWFVGYTPELVGGAWVGHDNPRSLGRKEGGSRTALPIWADMMKKALATGSWTKRDFAQPDGLVSARVDPGTGKLAYEGQQNAIEELFLEGTVPVEVALPPDILDDTSFLQEQLGGLDEVSEPEVSKPGSEAAGTPQASP